MVARQRRAQLPPGLFNRQSHMSPRFTEGLPYSQSNLPPLEGAIPVVRPGSEPWLRAACVSTGLESSKGLATTTRASNQDLVFHSSLPGPLNHHPGHPCGARPAVWLWPISRGFRSVASTWRPRAAALSVAGSWAPTENTPWLAASRGHQALLQVRAVEANS